jgi:hypothetical protein
MMLYNPGKLDLENKYKELNLHSCQFNGRKLCELSRIEYTCTAEIMQELA